MPAAQEATQPHHQDAGSRCRCDATHDVNSQRGGRQHIGTQLDSHVKIKRWSSKGMREKNPSRLFGADRKIRPSGSLFDITRQSLVMLTVTPDGSLHQHPTLMKDSYNIKRSFRTDWSGQTVLTQISLGSSLIRVSTVRHSICIILIHNFIENPYL